MSGVTRAAQGGLQVGRGQQTTAAVPRGAPAALAATLRRLTGDVFAHGYITAMRPTLAVSAGLLLAGAVFCLLLPRRTAPVTPAPVADADAAPAQVSGEQAG